MRSILLNPRGAFFIHRRTELISDCRLVPLDHQYCTWLQMGKYVHEEVLENLLLLSYCIKNHGLKLNITSPDLILAGRASQS